MSATPRRFGTVAVVVSTAVLTAALTAGGPALAASVVDFAKNAGAVDGRSAVAATASVNQRKGKLVATGGTTGQLPNNIIAQAPDSGKLGGVPLSGLAPALLHATRVMSTITSQETEFCRTPVLATSTASVATVEGDVNFESAPPTVPTTADATTPVTAVRMTIQVSLDGGRTWENADQDWDNVVTATPDDPFAAVAHSATIAVPAHSRLVFALGLGLKTSAAPSATECSVTATVLHRIPGTVLATNDAPPLLKTARGGSLFGRAG